MANVNKLFTGCYGDNPQQGPGDEVNIVSAAPSNLTVYRAGAVTLSQQTIHFALYRHIYLLRCKEEVVVFDPKQRLFIYLLRFISGYN